MLPRLSLTLLLVFTALIPCWAQTHNLITNGGFETVEHDGMPSDWQAPPGATTVQDVKRSGRRSILISRQGGALQDCWRAVPGRTYTCSMWAKIEAVKAATEEPGYAYLAAYQYDHRKRLIAYRDFMHGTGTEDWRRPGAILGLCPLQRLGKSQDCRS